MLAWKLEGLPGMPVAKWAAAELRVGSREAPVPSLHQFGGCDDDTSGTGRCNFLISMMLTRV